MSEHFKRFLREETRGNKKILYTASPENQDFITRRDEMFKMRQSETLKCAMGFLEFTDSLFLSSDLGPVLIHESIKREYYDEGFTLPNGYTVIRLANGIPVYMDLEGNVKMFDSSTVPLLPKTPPEGPHVDFRTKVHKVLKRKAAAAAINKMAEDQKKFKQSKIGEYL